MSRIAFGDLRVQLQTLRWLGVFQFTVKFEKCVVLESAFEQRRARFHLAGVFAITCSLVTYSFYYPYHFTMGKHNSTGNCYALVNIRTCSLVTLIVYIQLYIRRFRFAKLLQSMLRFNQSVSGCNKPLRNLWFPYVLHLTLFLTCMLNYAHGYWVAGVRLETIPVYLFQYGFAYLILGQLVVLFVGIQHIIKSTLMNYNRILMADLNSYNMYCEFYKNICDYKELLWVCQADINYCFGQLLLSITGFILLITPSGPFFLISTIFDGRFRVFWRFTFMCLTAIYWSLPWVTLLVLSMETTDVQREANKTAKMLAKVPRTGKGLDRMIQKFLLKNLRQQPILTAYGFFALDRSTLFKVSIIEIILLQLKIIHFFQLFTAISTYMVILVQFKEMENSAKSVNKF
ncbi:hypothetical protein KR009_006918 [Drosophila setifemur]|nr:hypothetical protein KR009_006918 [Drosophila setifemur]